MRLKKIHTERIETESLWDFNRAHFIKIYCVQLYTQSRTKRGRERENIRDFGIQLCYHSDQWVGARHPNTWKRNKFQLDNNEDNFPHIHTHTEKSQQRKT